MFREAPRPTAFTKGAKVTISTSPAASDGPHPLSTLHGSGRSLRHSQRRPRRSPLASGLNPPPPPSSSPSLCLTRRPAIPRLHEPVCPTGLGERFTAGSVAAKHLAGRRAGPTGGLRRVPCSGAHGTGALSEPSRGTGDCLALVLVPLGLILMMVHPAPAIAVWALSGCLVLAGWNHRKRDRAAIRAANAAAERRWRRQQLLSARVEEEEGPFTAQLRPQGPPRQDGSEPQRPG